MNIPKPMTVKNYRKTFSKINDAVHVVDVVYERYWVKKKLEWVGHLWKTSGNQVTKLKEKIKTTKWEGCLTDTNIDRLQIYIGVTSY